MGNKVIMYKLVSRNWETHGGMKWAIGKTNRATGLGIKMCSGDVLHCYKTPEQAALFNAAHANINDPILLKIDCSEIVANDVLKYACKEQTPITICELPEFTTKQRVAFAIKCALLVYKVTPFVKWATAWLSGEDRSSASASAAASSASASSASAVYAASAASASASAVYAASSVYASASSVYAVYAASAASYAAYAASYAAYRSADFAEKLQETINWVITEFKE